ncbi:zinc-binding dehydrogenase [Runella sp. SP2]|uniref:zinc-dependent alcohol dehydrogenase n=1 Tax=Runella sp. SP2 TaxID=2268026 RepID=UPI000F093735|nr:alcohol dehydrogenase catalytic domain-containing protein [Runella sp. SP2]AYQ32550.1 L-iditol 2-dehydrogenase [Runella sp. SP2]
MKAAFLEGPKKIVQRTIDTPEPKAGEVRIKLSKVGICGSDVHLFLGHRSLSKPTIIGHEGLGMVDKVGEGVIGRKVGERVAVEPNIPCQRCKFCQSGRGYICSNKRVVGLLENGCFAEYVCLPSDFAWSVPDEISDEDAVCIEPMAVGVHALFSSSAKPGDTIAIVGLGAIGLLLNHLALRLGYQVLVTEINQNKLQKAVQEGAIAANGDAETLLSIWTAQEVVAVFECAGLAATATLVASAAPRGAEIVLVGLSEKPAEFVPLKIAREGITIVPSIIYHHPTDFKRTIQLIQRKVVSPSKIISSFAPFGALQTALETASKGGESKIVVTM